MTRFDNGVGRQRQSRCTMPEPGIPSDPVTRVLSLLEPVQQRGRGWQARCPVHGDTRPSLDIDVGDDGRVLLNCRSANCTAEKIVAALGLTLRDLFPDGHGTSTNGASTAGGGRAGQSSRTFPTIDDAVRAACGTDSCGGSWVYHGPTSDEVMLVVRRNQRGGKKTFRQFHREPAGWAFGAPPAPRPLYRLLQLAKSQTRYVFVTEGEKCADAVAALGLSATTSPGGATNAHHADWSPLIDLIVTILEDNDDAGRRYGRDAARLILALNPNAQVCILRLPGLPERGDVVDWIAARRQEGLDDAAIAERLSTMEGNPVPIQSRQEASDDEDGSSLPMSSPVMICFKDIEPQEIRWLWKQVIPRGRLSLLVGAPGVGKSYLTAFLAACVSTGHPFPDGAPCEQGSVIMISAEDNPSDTIRPRLDAHGADVSRVHLLSAVRRTDGKGRQHEVMFTLDDLVAMERAIQQYPDVKVVFLDPIGSFLGGQVDAHRDNEVRRVLAPLAKLAEKYDLAIVVVAHRRKGNGGTADEQALGSRAFTGIARAVWHLLRAPKDKNRRLFLAGKQNLGPEGIGLAFRIAGNPVPAIEWEHDPVAITADEVLGQERASSESRPGPEPKRQGEAMEWLRGVLRAAPLPVSSIQKEAEEAGMAWRTVQRGATEIGVLRAKNGMADGWTWTLPPPDMPTS